MAEGSKRATPKHFDVQLVNGVWEVRNPEGVISFTAVKHTDALRFAWVAARNERFAKARLLAADGFVQNEWNYPA